MPYLPFLTRTGRHLLCIVIKRLRQQPRHEKGPPSDPRGARCRTQDRLAHPPQGRGHFLRVVQWLYRLHHFLVWERPQTHSLRIPDPEGRRVLGGDGEGDLAIFEDCCFNDNILFCCGDNQFEGMGTTARLPSSGRVRRKTWQPGPKCHAAFNSK